jgi:hypothetical protein
VSIQAIRDYASVPVARRLQWIEEMIELRAALPAAIRRRIERSRAEARRTHR